MVDTRAFPAPIVDSSALVAHEIRFCISRPAPCETAGPPYGRKARPLSYA